LQNSTIIETVSRIAPHARRNYLDAIRRGGPLFEQHGITPPLRMEHLSSFVPVFFHGKQIVE
jgi:hypothetical protein